MGLIETIKHKLNPEIREKFRNLFYNHRKGLDHFFSNNTSLSNRYSTIFFPEMKFDDMKIVVESESTIISYDKQILRTEKLRKWNSDYKEKTQKSRNVWKKGCKFGVYKYDITFPVSQVTGNSVKLSFTIWQHFLFACYLGDDISFPDSLRYLKNNAVSTSTAYSETEWDTILTHLLAIKEQFPSLYVLWGHTTTDEGEKTVIANCSHIRKKLTEHKIPELFHKDIDTIPDNASIVIIDLFTSNKDIQIYIPNLFSIICDKTPFITYLSLKKEYDSDEAHAIYEADKKKKEEEFEKLIKELEREEAEKKFREELPSRLSECVNSWDNSTNGLRYHYLVDYYPTNRYENVPDGIWEDRWTVWNFKNTPGKISSENHNETLNEIIPQITNILKETFGELLAQLTLVCVPASSVVNNMARYKEFSNLLCANTGLTNSFDQINIIKDATPKHLGGTGKPELSYNNDFFNGRYVILFDDVITSGHSLFRMKRIIESMGATVICAFTIGKTM